MRLVQLFRSPLTLTFLCLTVVSIAGSSQAHYNTTSVPLKDFTVLVTGGLGFIGSHLVDSLMNDGHTVIVADNLSSGVKNNALKWVSSPRFKLIEGDVIDQTWQQSIGHIDQIYHLASPASPKHYQREPIKTLTTNTIGTLNILELAYKSKARIVVASTSEVYGSPQVHPQREDYWGHVNPVGPRSCYDEGKRVSEALAVAYRDQKNVSIGIARIFNTYGPRMNVHDGRVVPNFITQKLNNVSLTIYGDGRQTRSFQYISDLVSGLKKLMDARVQVPVNLGNPQEISILTLAKIINNLTTHNDDLRFSLSKLPLDDPPRRCPEISFAKEVLKWEPKVDIETGLKSTIEYFAQIKSRT